MYRKGVRKEQKKARERIFMTFKREGRGGNRMNRAVGHGKTRERKEEEKDREEEIEEDDSERKKIRKAEKYERLGKGLQKKKGEGNRKIDRERTNVFMVHS